MDRDTIQDYLRKSEFTEMQADTLARLLSQTVTKDDLRIATVELESKILESRSKLEGKILESRSELERKLFDLRNSLETKISSLETNMTRWAITLILSLGTLFALLDIFID